MRNFWNLGLEDAKTFGKDVYALIVDITSAFNTTDHDRMLWIMYDLGFPTDAIDTVKHLYEAPPPMSDCPQDVALENPSFLRWLHVGGRGCKHGCIPGQNVTDAHLVNVLSSAAFADDLLYPTSTIQDLKVQARKLTLYSDWAALVISGSKIKATGILHTWGMFGWCAAKAVHRTGQAVLVVSSAPLTLAGFSRQTSRLSLTGGVHTVFELR
eukprot:1151857-Pelagomonas_calceolata.AAC.2